MCKALEDLMMQSEKRGMLEGRKEGRIEGRKEIRQEDVRKLMKNLQMTAQQAMDVLEIPKRERKEFMKLLG